MKLLRSINIADDRTRQEVIAAYRPTRKTLQVVRAVIGLERSTATHVVAPYGAGKSLAALAGITLLAGDPAMAQHLVFVSGDVLHRNWDQVKAVADLPVIEKPFDPQQVREAALALLAAKGVGQ